MPIRRNPAVPDNIFELEPQNLMSNYARVYGDEIARRYEDLNIIYFPYFPITLDLEFLHSISLPPKFKKLGTRDGIEKSLFARDGNTHYFDANNFLLKAFPEPQLAGYFQNQVISGNWQIREALRTLLPHYLSLTEGNITWRLTETINEGMHVDGFGGGKPTKPSNKGRLQRIKLFVNIDSEPRKWRTSFTLPEMLKRYANRLPPAVADDADLLSYRIGGVGFLHEAPYHEIDIPPMGAVMGEASAIAHAVRYGRRMIACEFFCHSVDMLDPAKQPQNAVKGWLADAGIGIDPNDVGEGLIEAARAYGQETGVPDLPGLGPPAA